MIDFNMVNFDIYFFMIKLSMVQLNMIFFIKLSNNQLFKMIDFFYGHELEMIVNV